MYQEEGENYIEVMSEDSKIDNLDPEIDKIEFLEIITSTFNKISSSLHPKLGKSLNQLSLLYSHFINQIEQINQEE